MSTAQTGRTHDLHPTASKKPKRSLDPWTPSTHDPQRTSQHVDIWLIPVRRARTPRLQLIEGFIGLVAVAATMGCA